MKKSVLTVAIASNSLMLTSLVNAAGKNSCVKNGECTKNWQGEWVCAVTCYDAYGQATSYPIKTCDSKDGDIQYCTP